MNDEQHLNEISNNQNIQSVHNSMLDGLSLLADYFGFSKVMGQLYGTLLLNPGPLSLDDMTERLDISKASVSTNMRTLEHMGMVRQVWVKGTKGRRKYYEAETDFWQIITNLLNGRELRDLDRAIQIMEENHKQLKNNLNEMSNDDTQLAQLYIERIQQLKGLFQFAQLIMTDIISQVTDTDTITDIKHIEIE